MCLAETSSTRVSNCCKQAGLPRGRRPGRYEHSTYGRGLRPGGKRQSGVMSQARHFGQTSFLMALPHGFFVSNA